MMCRSSGLCKVQMSWGIESGSHKYHDDYFFKNIIEYDLFDLLMMCTSSGLCQIQMSWEIDSDLGLRVENTYRR